MKTRRWSNTWVVRLLIAACLAAGAVIATLLSQKTAQAGNGLDQAVVIANTRGISSGSIGTFAQGSGGNTRPEFLDRLTLIGPAPLLHASGVAVRPERTGISPLNFVTTDNTPARTDFPPAVVGFSPTANGVNVLPEIVIQGPVGMSCWFLGSADLTCLDVPDGVAFDSMASPMVDTAGQVYVANLGPVLLDPSGNPCGAGSITVSESSTSGNVPPNRVIYGCNAALTYKLFLADPVGLFVDEAKVDLCLGTGNDAADLCSTSNTNCSIGNCLVPIQTRRIWAISHRVFWDTTQAVHVDSGKHAVVSETFFGGNVGIYTPELADEIDALGLAPSVTGQASFCEGNFCNEPVLGGFFFTTTDNLAPNGTSADTTNPNYLVVNSSETTAYISDYTTRNLSDPHRPVSFRSRVKAFALMAAPFCLAPYGSADNCNLAVKEFLGATFAGAIEGTHTRLKSPMGISAATVAGGDELFVTNVGSNSIAEFGPGATGDAAPIASIKGPKTGLIQPAGLAVTPPQMIP